VTDQLIDISLKSGLIALVGLGLAATMTGFHAAVRYVVVLVSLILCLAVPVAARFGPRHDVEIPALAVPVRAAAETAPKTREIKPREAKNDSSSPASIPTEWLLAMAYLTGAGLVAARYVVGLARLRQIDRRSQSAPEDVESLAKNLPPGAQILGESRTRRSNSVRDDRRNHSPHHFPAGGIRLLVAIAIGDGPSA